LQKAIYLAHGFYLAKTGNPLINEFFEAWRLGPVVRSVYDKYKDFGSQPIDRLTPGVAIGDIEHDEIAKYSTDNAWRIAKSVDAITLSNWTHAANSPWEKTIKSSGVYISNAELEKYFQEVFKVEKIV
jgi:uncharacterized phage-associated protein